MRGRRVVDGRYHTKRGRAAALRAKKGKRDEESCRVNSYGLSTVHTTGRVDEATRSGEDHG